MKKQLFPFLALMFLFLWGCSTPNTNNLTDAQNYLTPIPKATINAYRENMPITNKLEAAIAAQNFLETTRLDFKEYPKVIFVERTTLDEAYQKIHSQKPEDYDTENRQGKTKVWLVIVEGNFRIIPPLSEPTPTPYSHGCAYVIIDQNGANEMGTIACP